VARLRCRNDYIIFPSHKVNVTVLMTVHNVSAHVPIPEGRSLQFQHIVFGPVQIPYVEHNIMKIKENFATCTIPNIGQFV